MTNRLEQFEGRLALVTGAGDGIGRMLAMKLAQAGMRVCVQDIRAEAAEAVAQEIGPSAFPLSFDVSDFDQCAHAAETLKEHGAPLSLLWANAGVGVGARMSRGARNPIEWGVAVNILGLIWTVRAFLPLMKPEDTPTHIGFTASTAALVAPEDEYPFYAVTKHGSFAVAEAIRAEVRGAGIETTILCPGLLNTNIWDGARARPERFGGEVRMDPAIAATWRAAKPPEAMWPHIERVISEGGGYLVCATEPKTYEQFKARADDLGRAFVLL